ncbi:SCO family protein [Methylobacterium haplocladii]|uniref:Copper-binding protein n=1 Tax=Methylobacterium haplocladii TaxID=1176176 RepID=A0A512IKU6_9HYPH|nr:SCO family protein [Methylobacterium haplocladii]GEO98262.1 copper-binding protein [Methylobacterium haplocladii]GJD84343.1 SCO1 protein [Methylobacterium haplocladii]GLS58444.1 copper-binding protein [Methylobacterium haplocladii]
MIAKPRAFLILLAFAAGLVALSAAAMMYLAPKNDQAVRSAVGGPFTLVNQDGKTVTERDFAGATHLVFFGFTHCPDVCPTTLQQITDVLAALGPKADRLKVAFVTVDPERDTPEVLKTYLSSFDSRITGLTGTPEQVAATVKAYRGYARKVEGKDGDYVMEHTALVYVVDGRNDFVSALNLQRPPQDTAKELANRI